MKPRPHSYKPARQDRYLKKLSLEEQRRQILLRAAIELDPTIAKG